MTCIDAFKNLNIVSKNNTIQISPCCISPVQQVSKIDFYNNDYLVQVRQAWQRNRSHPACQACDRAGDTSRRTGSNTWYRDNGLYNHQVELIRLDYWTGDTCNLRCVICGPDNSSAWAKELALPLLERHRSSNTVWKTLDLSKLKYIHFNGGEPLLSKEHVEFLEAIPAKDQVHINYNTNGTVLPSKKLLELWARFRLVQLDFSIDDIGDRFEYQRFPASWTEVTRNLQWYIDTSPVNCMFAVNTTVGILNYANLSNLNSWLKSNFNANRVTDPIEYRTQPAMGLFALNSNKTLTGKMSQFLDECDTRRGTDWRKTFPELANSV